MGASPAANPISIFAVSGITSGRLVSVCGQIGVITNAETMRIHNRPARRKRIGRRTRRRRHDQSVGLVVAHKFAVDAQLQIDDARQRGLVQHRVIQRPRAMKRLALAASPAIPAARARYSAPGPLMACSSTG